MASQAAHSFIDARFKKAIERHNKFFPLWKNADPGLLEVEETRKRLVGFPKENFKVKVDLILVELENYHESQK